MARGRKVAFALRWTGAAVLRILGRNGGERAMSDDTMEIQNVGQPGKTYRVNAAKFRAMQAAVLAVLPGAAPGVAVPDLVRGVVPLLPQDLFPGGDTAGWWVKAVQLDQEAKGVIGRAKGSPVRLYRR
jgi:hypothetical protein